MPDQISASIAAEFLSEMRAMIGLTAIVILSAVVSVNFSNKSRSIFLLFAAVTLLGVYAVHKEETNMVARHTSAMHPAAK